MTNNQKRAVCYISYVFLFLLLIFIGLRFQAFLLTYGQNNYEILPYFLFKSVFSVVIGIYIGLPFIYRNFSSEGAWKVNWMKLAIIGLPFIYLAVLPVFYISGIFPAILPFTNYVLGGYFGEGASDTFETINGVVAGYIVITSIGKVRQT
ncbi:hypothetical protein [Sutcliffiella deserti]|uniref:hypothetical protein n=1 Tax=Sutcliffiella deserti TaxID=2875501 RepID=UPI001CBE502C|nr:hypothetical protein [Sutcliffiella deserti]